MQSFEIWVLQTLLDCVSFFWVEDQHFTQEIQGHWICFWIQTGPALFISLWQLPNVFPGQIISDESHIFVGWCSEYRNSSFDLIKIVITREKWCSSKQLSKDAADGPHIKSVGVVRSVQDNLWGTIPSSNDVLSKCGGSLLVSSGQTKITNFQITVFVEEQVAWLQISMDDV